MGPTLSSSSSEHCSDRSALCKYISVSQSRYDDCKVSNHLAIAIAEVHCEHINISGVKRIEMHKREKQVGLTLQQDVLSDLILKPFQQTWFRFHKLANRCSSGMRVSAKLLHHFKDAAACLQSC